MRSWLLPSIAAVGVSLLAGVVALSGMAGSGPTRGAMLAQLERPARVQPASGPGFFATVRRGTLRVRLTLGVNRAGVPDPASVRVARIGGRPIRAARVTLTYSMPAMRMWSVYSSSLAPTGTPGAYGATEAVLGMPGPWRIAVTVALPDGQVARFTVADRMPA